MPTAATSTIPTTMFCIGVSKPRRCMPDWSDCITSAPRTAPGMVPMPPANEVPPMTAAAMTYSSSQRPAAVRGGIEAGGRDDRR